MNRFFSTFYGCKNLILAGGLLVCVLLPDFITNAIMGSSRTFWNWISLLYLAPLCYGLTFLKKPSFVMIWSILGILEVSQFTHIAFFGVPLFPSAIRAIFSEYTDIFDPAYFKKVWFVLPVLSLVYAFGFYLFLKSSKVKKNSKILSFPIIIYSLSLIASDGMIYQPFRFIQLYKEESNNLLNRCLMKQTSQSLRSTIFALSCVGVQNLLAKNDQKLFKPYEITPIPSQAKNIILIMGESFSTRHMSLFGYHRKTTPNLEARTRDPRFLFKPSYSAAPNTESSVMRFFNLIQEPDNLDPIEKGEQNLFRRAKLNGFKTFLITTNSGSQGIGANIDDVRSSQLFADAYPQASYPEELMSLRDKAFPDMLKNLPLADKNFIVFHMRAAHSPYGKHYAQEKEQFSIYLEDGSLNSYDNCVHYLDALFEKIIHSFCEAFYDKGTSYLLFTADHSELFGDLNPETGEQLYGHGHLALSCAEVPFWMYALNANYQDLYHQIHKEPILSAYEIAEITLNLIGEKIHNPNHGKDIFYVCESLLKSNNRFIAYEKTKDGKASVVDVTNKNGKERS